MRSLLGRSIAAEKGLTTKKEAELLKKLKRLAKKELKQVSWNTLKDDMSDRDLMAVATPDHYVVVLHMTYNENGQAVRVDSWDPADGKYYRDYSVAEFEAEVSPVYAYYRS